MLIKLSDVPLYGARDVIRAFESTFQVTLSLHDLQGTLVDAEGKPLLREYLSHRHPYCFCGRYGDGYEPGFDGRCLKECACEVENEASRSEDCFLHECWKGAAELIVPVYREHRLCLILYAGVFRCGPAPKLRMLQKPFAELRELPSAEELQTIKVLLRNLGSGLLNDAAERKKNGAVANGRNEEILSYLKKNLADPGASLAGLSSQMSLSKSRVRHLVTKLFGLSFQALLLRERMNHARNLLLYARLPPKNVAAAVGLPSVPYFYRCFKRFFGLPPGKYRLRHNRDHF